MSERPKYFLEKRIELANVNLEYQGLKMVRTKLIMERFNGSEIKLRNGECSKVFNSSREILDYNCLRTLNDIQGLEELDKFIDNYITSFKEKCETQKYENCNEPHITNLFIYSKGKFYGIDEWEKML